MAAAICAADSAYGWWWWPGMAPYGMAGGGAGTRGSGDVNDRPIDAAGGMDMDGIAIPGGMAIPGWYMTGTPGIIRPACCGYCCIAAAYCIAIGPPPPHASPGAWNICGAANMGIIKRWAEWWGICSIASPAPGYGRGGADPVPLGLAGSIAERRRGGVTRGAGAGEWWWAKGAGKAETLWLRAIRRVGVGPPAILARNLE